MNAWFESEVLRARHAAGMAAASGKTAARRLSGEALKEVRARNRQRWPCEIAGCGLTAYKGALCRKHWAMVPIGDRVALGVAAARASHETARESHRQLAAELQERLNART